MKNDSSREAGFTLIELIVAVAIFAVLVAIAVPSMNTYRGKLQFRQEASRLVKTIREAKNRAIATNRQHRVELVPATGASSMQIGNRATNTTTWTAVSGYAAALPAGVIMRKDCSSTDPIYVVLNPNGTAELYTPDATARVVSLSFCVQGAGSSDVYTVRLLQSGLVRMEKN